MEGVRVKISPIMSKDVVLLRPEDIIAGAVVIFAQKNMGVPRSSMMKGISLEC